ncbi:MAG: hypothetical protein P8X96_02015 [Desulfobacteraceae bacterium]
MDLYSVFPDREIRPRGAISKIFVEMNLASFQGACAYVHHLPYGYNANRDDLMSLFEDGKGSCTTKHAVIATLALELDLSVRKWIGIYAMTEALVTGTAAIIERYALPYLPMVHCFLSDGCHRVDLTQGNVNGKNGPIDDFLYTAKVDANISAKDEYRLYRNVLKDKILNREEFQAVELKTVLKAREEGLALLKTRI